MKHPLFFIFTCLACLTAAGPQAYGATGILEIDFTGRSLRELQVASVTVRVGRQTQKLDAAKQKQKLYFYLFPGTYAVGLTAYGKVAFTRHIGQVEISPKKQSRLHIDLGESLATLALRLPEAVTRARVLLFAARRNGRPLARFTVPDNGLVPNLAATPMWMVLLDQKGKVITNQWIDLKAGSTTTIQVLEQDIPEQVPLKIMLRSDLPGPVRKDGSSVTARVAGGRRIPLQQNGNLFAAEVPPGKTVLEVNHPGFGKVTSDTLFPGYFDEKPLFLLLHVLSGDDFFWCTTAAMQKSTNWSHDAETLKDEGRLFDALMLYRLADPCNPDDSGRRNILKLGRELASRARSQGRLFNRGAALFTREPDSSACRNRRPHPAKKQGVCLNGDLYDQYPLGGSIEWLAATSNKTLLPAEVARFIQTLDPLQGAGRAKLVREFVEREGIGPDSQTVPSLVTTLLAREELSFQQAQTGSRNAFSGAEIFNAGVKASLAWIQEARQCAALSGTAVDPTVQRTILRVKTLASASTYAALAAALSYSLLAGDTDTMTSVQKRAATLAYQAMEQKNFDKARDLLSIADDRKGMVRLKELEQQDR